MKKKFEFETLILRFRDLVTGLGETIENHSRIIDDYIGEDSYVWWGWWNKNGEILPDKEFNYLHELATRGLLIYLVDSGREKVYQALCKGISFNNSECISSPAPSHTPAYYNMREYLAWFKLTNISEIDEDVIKDLTYVRVDAFFEDTPSRYGEFYGKKIYNIKELMPQNRTIWFVRKYRKDTDSVHQVELLNANKFSPQHFSTEYFHTKSNQILWLSDLHFPDSPYRENNGIDKHSLWNRIKNTLAHNGLENKFASLIITGDITSQGNETGFIQANEFLREMNSDFSEILESRSVIFCPGNHDFKFSDDSPSKKHVEPINTVGFSDFYKQIHFIPPNNYYTCGKKLMLNNGFLVDIVSLNSIMLEQYPRFHGQGFLGQNQLDDAASRMGWIPQEYHHSIRIVMMHHHYMPTCYQDSIDIDDPSSSVYDAERLADWISKYNVKVLLHGHKHNSFFSKVSRPHNLEEDIKEEKSLYDFYVFGLGSTGTKIIGGENHPNMFAIIKIEYGNLIITYYKMNPVGSNTKMREINVPLQG